MAENITSTNKESPKSNIRGDISANKVKEESEKQLSKEDQAKKDEEDRLAAPPNFTRPVVARVVEYDSVILHEFETFDQCDGATLVEGFPSEGLTSILVANYLVEELKLPLIGVMTSKAFPPMVLLQDYKPSHGCRLYGNNKIVVAMCEYKLTAELSHDVAHALFNICKRHKFAIIISTEGIPTDLDIDETKVTSQYELMQLVQEKTLEESKKPIEDIEIKFITTMKKVGEELKASGAGPVKAAAVGGLTGAVISTSIITVGVDILALFAVVANAIPDGRGAHAIVLQINKVLNLDIDVGPLAEQVKTMEKKVQTVLSGLANPKMARRGKSSYPGMYT